LRHEDQPDCGVSDPVTVKQQAAMVAAAWSPPGAPTSWRLTATQFETLGHDPEMLAIAATIPEDRLPALLFEAAATFLVLELEPQPLRDWFPRLGEPQPPVGQRFASEYRGFCLSHRDRLLDLCSSHRYQMNEVGRCAHVVPALAGIADDDRHVALVDVGTGAGLALGLDRYRYSYIRDGEQQAAVGAPDSEVLIETELRGRVAAPVPVELPSVVDRVGIDIEPVDIGDPAVRSWLAACIPQEIGAVTRFDSASRLASAHPARLIRGDACDLLSAVLDEIPSSTLICLMDTYVHVFFAPDELLRFRALVDELGADRDLDWVSIDPLVPMGPGADKSVLGLPVPRELVERGRSEGVFGVVGRVSYRGGRKSGVLLGLAHPGAAWLEWLTAVAGNRFAAG
jgi:hypothetical protein